MTTVSRGALPVLGAIILATGATLLLYGRFIASLPTDDASATTEVQGDPLITRTGNSSTVTAPTLRDHNPRLGNRDAKIRIYEYSDFGCPYCQVMAVQLRRLVTANADIEVVWKHFPVGALHPTSPAAHAAAYCANEQGKFWEYHDRLFVNQSRLSEDALLGIANATGLDMNDFSNCLASGKPTTAIAMDVSEGNALGIDGTPYLVVGDQHISGLTTYEELEQIVTLHRKLAN